MKMTSVSSNSSKGKKLVSEIEKRRWLLGRADAHLRESVIDAA